MAAAAAAGWTRTRPPETAADLWAVVVRYLSVREGRPAARLTLKTSVESANCCFFPKRITGAVGHSGSRIVKDMIGAGRGVTETEGELCAGRSDKSH